MSGIRHQSVLMNKFLINSLAVECPELAKDWHPINNLPLTAESVSFGTNKRVWWLCHKCGYEWQAYINNRRKQYRDGFKDSGSSCPNCIGRVVNNENSFATHNPELIKEWHPTKNDPNKIYNIPKCCKEKFWWLCKNCEHEWQATPASRNSGSGCPLCNKNKRAPSLLDAWRVETRKLVVKSTKDKNE